MKKTYILIILILTCLVFASCNKKQVSEDNTKQTVAEQNKEETKTDITANNSEKPAENNNENNTPNEQITYNVYSNPRYGFSIEYPSTLKERKEPDNGDGVTLSSSKDNVELTVFGSNNILNETVQSALNSILGEHPNAPYKQQGGNWFVVSWIEGDRIIYYKSVIGEGSSNTFIFKYPSNQKEYYDSIVTRINSSFKAPGIATGH